MDKTIYIFKSQVFADSAAQQDPDAPRFVIDRTHPQDPNLVWLLCVSDFTLSMTDYVSRDCIQALHS